MTKLARHLPLLLGLLIFSLSGIATPARCAQPPTYTRQANFTDHSQNFPTVPQNGTDLDNEYNAVKTTLDATLANLALIQRADGHIANGTIGIDQLQPGLTIGVNPVGDWATSTVYAINDAVWKDSALYRCAVAHTSGTFSTDLANGDWQNILDISPYLDTAAASAAAAASSATAAASSATTAASLASQLSGTSTSSVSIATGAKTFTTQSGKFFSAGMSVFIPSAAAPTTNNMFGTVTSYSGTTLITNITAINGSGSHTDWTINVSGAQGAPGATGASGAGTGDMLAANNLSDLINPNTSRTNLGVAIGVNVQAYDADLTGLSQCAGSANKLCYFTGAGTAAAVDYSSAARTFDAATTALAERTAIGITLGTAANNVVQLDGSAKLPAMDGSQLTNLPTGGSLQFIQSKQASSSSTLDFTGLSSDCSAYKFIIAGISPSSGTPAFVFRTSIDNGVTFYSSNADYVWISSVLSSSGTTGTEILSASGSSTLSQYFKIGDFADNRFGGELTIYDTANTSYYRKIISDVGIGNTTFKFSHVVGTSQHAGDVINAVRFLFTSGNIQDGKIYEYCLKSS